MIKKQSEVLQCNFTYLDHKKMRKKKNLLKYDSIEEYLKEINVGFLGKTLRTDRDVLNDL